MDLWSICNDQNLATKRQETETSLHQSLDLSTMILFYEVWELEWKLQIT